MHGFLRSCRKSLTHRPGGLHPGMGQFDRSVRGGRGHAWIAFAPRRRAGEQPMSAGVWTATIAAIVGLLVLDFVVAARRPHHVGIREATFWSVFYIGIALAFGVVLLVAGDDGQGTEYFAGWVVEKSLSVDNLFVF